MAPGRRGRGRGRGGGTSAAGRVKLRLSVGERKAAAYEEERRKNIEQREALLKSLNLLQVRAAALRLLSARNRHDDGVNTAISNQWTMHVDKVGLLKLKDLSSPGPSKSGVVCGLTVC